MSILTYCIARAVTHPRARRCLTSVVETETISIIYKHSSMIYNRTIYKFGIRKKRVLASFDFDFEAKEH